MFIENEQFPIILMARNIFFLIFQDAAEYLSKISNCIINLIGISGLVIGIAEIQLLDIRHSEENKLHLEMDLVTSPFIFLFFFIKFGFYRLPCYKQTTKYNIKLLKFMEVWSGVDAIKKIHSYFRNLLISILHSYK